MDGVIRYTLYVTRERSEVYFGEWINSFFRGFSLSGGGSHRLFLEWTLTYDHERLLKGGLLQQHNTAYHRDFLTYHKTAMGEW